jgi:uncharacterized SAM-binding protein YcdF (DUF218 family)
MHRTAIVLLGATNDSEGHLSSLAKDRCQTAVTEYARHPGAKIIPTGGWGSHFNTTSKSHAYYLREHLKSLGIPETDILAAVESSNTIDDARLSRSVVESHGFDELIIVTSDFHMDRAAFLFGRDFPDRQLVFSPSRTHLPEEELTRRKAHELDALKKLKGLSHTAEPPIG